MHVYVVLGTCIEGGLVLDLRTLWGCEAGWMHLNEAQAVTGLGT